MKINTLTTETTKNIEKYKNINYKQLLKTKAIFEELAKDEKVKISSNKNQLNIDLEKPSKYFEEGRSIPFTKADININTMDFKTKKDEVIPFYYKTDFYFSFMNENITKEKENIKEYYFNPAIQNAKYIANADETYNEIAKLISPIPLKSEYGIEQENGTLKVETIYPDKLIPKYKQKAFVDKNEIEEIEPIKLSTLSKNNPFVLKIKDGENNIFTQKEITSAEEVSNEFKELFIDYLQNKSYYKDIRLNKDGKREIKVKKLKRFLKNFLSLNYKDLDLVEKAINIIEKTHNYFTDDEIKEVAREVLGDILIETNNLDFESHEFIKKIKEKKEIEGNITDINFYEIEDNTFTLNDIAKIFNKINKEKNELYNTLDNEFNTKEGNYKLYKFIKDWLDTEINKRDNQHIVNIFYLLQQTLPYLHTENADKLANFLINDLNKKEREYLDENTVYYLLRVIRDAKLSENTASEIFKKFENYFNLKVRDMILHSLLENQKFNNEIALKVKNEIFKQTDEKHKYDNDDLILRESDIENFIKKHREIFSTEDIFKIIRDLRYLGAGKSLVSNEEIITKEEIDKILRDNEINVYYLEAIVTRNDLTEEQVDYIFNNYEEFEKRDSFLNLSDLLLNENIKLKSEHIDKLLNSRLKDIYEKFIIDRHEIPDWLFKEVLENKHLASYTLNNKKLTEEQINKLIEYVKENEDFFLSYEKNAFAVFQNFTEEQINKIIKEFNNSTILKGLLKNPNTKPYQIKEILKQINYDYATVRDLLHNSNLDKEIIEYIKDKAIELNKKNILEELYNRFPEYKEEVNDIEFKDSIKQNASKSIGK